MIGARLLVIRKGEHRFVIRWFPGGEGALLAELVRMSNDPGSGLAWADILPVLQGLREYVLNGGPVVLVCQAPQAP